MIADGLRFMQIRLKGNEEQMDLGRCHQSPGRSRRWRGADADYGAQRFLDNVN